MSSSNAERAGELLSAVPSILVHSGNVASWNKLRRKGVLAPTDEVRRVLKAATDLEAPSDLSAHVANFYHRGILHKLVRETK